MRIAIFGLTKTGTSALFAKLRDAMPADTVCYFEPGPHHRRVLWQRRLARLVGIGRRRPLLVKFVPFEPGAVRYVRELSPFDHEIFIHRDPRDRLVSLLLYDCYNSSLPQRPDGARAFLAMLEAKQQDPKSISVVDLVGEFHRAQGRFFALDQWLADYAAANVLAPLAFAAQHEAMILYAYEEMIAQNYAKIAAATALVLDRSEPDVGKQLQRVVRSKKAGDWRNWFTPQDIATLQPVLQPYLDAYYPQADWTVADEQSISPELGSRYVARILDERRVALRLPPVFGEAA